MEVELKETKKEQHEIEKQLVDSNILGIIANSFLVISAILGSNFFGIPEYIYNIKTKNPFKIFLYIIGFILVQVLYAVKYLYHLVILDFKNIKNDSNEKNAIISVVSMMITACFSTNVYLYNLKKVTAEQIIENQNK